MKPCSNLTNKEHLGKLTGPQVVFCICGVLRFRGNWGLQALITITALRVPAAQGGETLPGRGTTEAPPALPSPPHSRLQRSRGSELPKG